MGQVGSEARSPEGDINVGINGLGAIGRGALKTLWGKPGVNIVGINDSADPAALADLLQFDTGHGRWDRKVEARDGGLVIDGEKVPLTQVKSPAEIGWGERGNDVVVAEATGRFTSREAAVGHLRAGAGRVIISAPGEGTDGSYVIGVNHGGYDPDTDRIIDTTSCTSNALFPVVAVLDELAAVRGLVFDTIHAYTADQVLVDAPHGDLRRGRAAGSSIVPTSTGAAKVAGKIFPNIVVSMGMAHRVPVLVGSEVIVTAMFEDRLRGIEELREAFKDAAKTARFNGVMRVSEEPLVSARIVGDPHSSIVDLPMMAVQGDVARVLAWYDNVAGYSARLAEAVMGSKKKAFGRSTEGRLRGTMG